MTALYASGLTRTRAVSRMCTRRKKKIATPVMRCSTHDHIPSRPRYSVPPGLCLAGFAGAVRVPAEVSGMNNPPWLCESPRTQGHDGHTARLESSPAPRRTPLRAALVSRCRDTGCLGPGSPAEGPLSRGGCGAAGYPRTHVRCPAPTRALLQRDPRRRRRIAPVAALPRRCTEVPARPHGVGADPPEGHVG